MSIHFCRLYLNKHVYKVFAVRDIQHVLHYLTGEVQAMYALSPAMLYLLLLHYHIPVLCTEKI